MVRRGESIIINGARIARGRQKYINRKKKRMDSLGSTIYLLQNDDAKDPCNQPYSCDVTA